MCSPNTHFKADRALPPDFLKYSGEMFCIGWNRWQQVPVISWHDSTDAVFGIAFSLLPFFTRICTHPSVVEKLNRVEELNSSELIDLMIDVSSDVLDVFEIMRNADQLGVPDHETPEA